MNHITFSIPATYVLYILLTIIPPILISKERKVKNRKVVWVLAWLVLTIPLGIRYQTGVDWTLYQEAFDVVIRYGSHFWKAAYNIENTFKLFAFVSHEVAGSSIILFFLYAGLANLFAFIGIYRFKDTVNAAWAMFVYTTLLYVIQYNIARQFLAMMIVFAGTKEVINRKFIRYALWVLIAALFHKTAILMIVVYLYGFAADEKFKTRKLFNIVCYIISVAAIMVVPKLTTIAAFILNTSKYDGYNLTGTFSLGFGILIQITMLLLLFLSYTKNRCNLANNEALLNYGIRTFVLGNIMYLLQYMLDNFGGRISLYFMPVEILLFGQMLDGLDLKGTRIKGGVLKIVIFCFLLARAVYGIVTNSQGHVPYSCYTF